MDKSREKAKKGTIWVGLQQIIGQFLNYGTLIVLSQLLVPEDFGLQTTVMVIIGFVSVFQDFGLRSAIIRMNIDSKDNLSSFFWFSFLVGIVLFISVLFFGEWILIGLLNNQENLWITHELLIGQASVIILINLAIVSEALLLREMMFKQIFVVILIGYLLSAFVSILLAIKGYGPWALIAKQVILVGVQSVGYLIAARWVPKLAFSTSSLKEQFRFTSNLTAGNIVNYFTRNIDYILISKFLSTEALGQYSLAYRIMLTPMKNISSVAVKVIYPVLAQIKRTGKNSVEATYLRTVQLISYLAFPVMAILSAMSFAITDLVFGEQWYALPILIAVFSWLGAFQATTSPVGTLFLVSGRTDKMLYFQILATIFTAGMVAISLNWGINGVAIVLTTSWIFIMFPFTNRFAFLTFDMTFSDLLRKIRPSLISALIIWVLIFLSQQLEILMGWVSLILLISMGLGFYLLIMKRFFGISLLSEFKGFIRPLS